MVSFLGKRRDQGTKKTEEVGESASLVTWPSGTAWRRPARSRVPAGGVGRARAPTGRAHAQGGAPPLPRGEGVYGEAAAAAAEAEAEAVAMAPFPEEVDVFTAPHWRMKQLVGLYCDKVTVCRASCSGQRGPRGGAGRSPGGLACAAPAAPGAAAHGLPPVQLSAPRSLPAPSPGSPRPDPAGGLGRALGGHGAAPARLRAPGGGPRSLRPRWASDPCPRPLRERSSLAPYRPSGTPGRPPALGFLSSSADRFCSCPPPPPAAPPLIRLPARLGALEALFANTHPSSEPLAYFLPQWAASLNPAHFTPQLFPGLIGKKTQVSRSGDCRSFTFHLWFSFSSQLLLSWSIYPV